MNVLNCKKLTQLDSSAKFLAAVIAIGACGTFPYLETAKKDIHSSVNDPIK